MNPHWGRYNFLLYFCTLALAACSGPVELPPVPGSRAPETDLVFHERLAAEDIQTLFKSLNRTHRLDPLIPYVVTPSPAALVPVGDLISKHFYESVFARNGLVQLLDRRAKAGDLSRWAKETDFADSETKAALSALAHLASDPGFPDLLARDSALLTPAFGSAWDAAAAAKLTLKYPETAPPVARDQWVKDAVAFFSDPKNAAAAKELSEKLSESEFATAALRTLQKAGTRAGTLEGFGAGIARLISTRAGAAETQLEKLLRLFDLLGQPTAGLFSVAQETLRKEPHRIRELTNQFQGAIASAVRGFVREALIELHAQGSPVLPPREPGAPLPQEWIQTFIAVRGAIENVTGPAADEQAQDALLKNLPIYLNAYVITRWLEQSAAALPDKPEPPFSRETETPEFQLSLAGPNATGQFELDANVKRDLEGLGLVDFTKALGELVQKEGFGNYQYDVPALKGTLKDLVGTAVDRCHQVRPFADGAAYLRAVAFGLTREEGGFGFQLADLESENLADDVNQTLSSLSLESWRKVRRVLFEDIKIGNLDADTKELILSLYDSDPKLRKKAQSLFETVSAIEELDRPDHDLPSAFETYWQLLTLISPDDIGSVSAVFRFLSRTELVKGAAAAPRYPGVVQFLKQRSGLAGLLQSLAAVPARSRRSLVEGLGEALGPDAAGTNGTELHFALLADLLAKSPEGTKVAIGSLHRLGWGVLPSLASFPAPERDWLREFLSEGDFPALWQFVSSHGEPGSLKRLTELLNTLSAQGYLAEAIDLLGHFRGDRLKTLSNHLADWERTGELKALLALIDGYVSR